MYFCVSACVCVCMYDVCLCYVCLCWVPVCTCAHMCLCACVCNLLMGFTIIEQVASQDQCATASLIIVFSRCGFHIFSSVLYPA